MRSTNSLGLCGTLLAIAIVLAACDRDSQPNISNEAKVDALLAGYAEGVQPGVAIAVVQNGNAVLLKGYGYADIERQVPIGSNTDFRLASVSKQFAAMAIVMLDEAGKLSLDDPIGKYVPELSVYEGVTIRHLLLHTGGLPDYYDTIDTSAGMPTNADAAVELGKMAVANFAAGERYEYSNPGYDMLGPIVAKASGVSFAEFVETNIFGRLGMSGSRVHDDRLPEIPNRSTGYAPDGDGFVLDDDDPLNVIIGSGGIYSNLIDMMKWDRGLYSNILLSDKGLELVFTSGTNNAGEALGYGLGWRIETIGGHKQLRHGGSWVGFRTHIARIPDLQFSVILLSNRGDFDAEQLSDEITEIYLGPLQPR